MAEIGACFLGAQIGVAPEFGQSAAYVEGWLKALKEDKRAIFRAASEAQKAADFVLRRRWKPRRPQHRLTLSGRAHAPGHAGSIRHIQ